MLIRLFYYSLNSIIKIKYKLFEKKLRRMFNLKLSATDFFTKQKLPNKQSIFQSFKEI